MLDVRLAIQSLADAATPDISEIADAMTLPIAPNASLDAELRASREHARRLTEMFGPHASETAAAWDAVEELLATKAHQRTHGSNSFQTYCYDNPEAPEARAYDL